MSEFDYYQVLQLNRTATVDDIRKAFRRLSLKYHPTKNPADITVCSDQFHQICEAYEVLSDFKSRTVYDKYGSETLSRGIHSDTVSAFQGYKYKRNPFVIFENFFKEYLPYHEIFDDTGVMLHGSCFGYAFGGILNTDKHAYTPDDIHVDWECTIEELYNGCFKTIQYTRNIITLDSQVSTSDETKTIEVKPGFKHGHQILIKKEGSNGFNGECKDLIIHIVELKDSKYTRKGNDLIYKHDISLVDALNSSPCKFKTLDGRTLNVSIDEIISPQTVKIIEDEGMPIYDEEVEKLFGTWSAKGKMFLVFNIIFPIGLSEEKKNRIAEILNAGTI